MFLIVGLGNPGREYQMTRHNAGFLMLDELKESYGGEEFQKHPNFKGEVSTCIINTQKVMLLKPSTYMNLSGESVRAVMQFYKLPLTHILVLYDDVDIPTGTRKIRIQGSPGTHNGMKSLVQCLGSQHFARIRLGIAPIDSFPGALSDYVLGKFTEEEKAALFCSTQAVKEGVEAFLEGKIEEAMNRWNGKDTSQTSQKVIE